MLDLRQGRAKRGVKVPVGEVVAEAYRGVFGRLGLFLELAWLPLLVVLAAALIPGLVSDYLMPQAGGERGAGVSLGDAVEALTAFLCFNAFWVRWHHAAFFPDPHHLPKGLFRRAWGRFLIYAVAFSIPAFVLMAVLTLPPALVMMGALADAPGPGGALAATVATAAVTLPVGLAITRCSLLLPAAAFGQPLSWGAAWRLMRGNTWRLFWATLLVCVPVMLAVLLLLDGILKAARLDPAAALAAGRLPLGAFILHAVAGTLLNFLVVALAAQVLSGFYRRIVLRSDL